MTQDKFPKTVRGFYWLIIKHFPFTVGIVFFMSVLGYMLDMLFRPLSSKWLVEIFENAVNSNYSDILVLVLLLFGMYSYGILLSFVENIIRGNKEQIFNRKRIFNGCFLHFRHHINMMQKHYSFRFLNMSFTVLLCLK